MKSIENIVIICRKPEYVTHCHFKSHFIFAKYILNVNSAIVL